MAAPTELMASKRFLSSLRRQSPVLKRKTFLTVNDIVERYENAVSLANSQTKRVQGIRAPVWRVRLDDYFITGTIS